MIDVSMRVTPNLMYPKVLTPSYQHLMADAPDHRLSIRNIWHGAVGWLIEGAERRVMVRCVSAWTVTGVTKGLTWLSADAVLTGGAPLTPSCAKTRPTTPSCAKTRPS